MHFTRWLLIKAIRGYISTIRLRIVGERREGVFYLMWHSKLLITPRIFMGIRASALVSPSRDGQYVSALLRDFGYGVIESSYRKRRLRGAVEMVRRFKRGEAIGITPDGPLGPPRRIKPELFHLLNKLDAPIGFVGIGYSRFWRANSWDRFEVPYPFSRAVAIIEYAKGGDFSSAEEMDEFLNKVNSVAEEMALSGIPIDY